MCSFVIPVGILAVVEGSAVPWAVVIAASAVAAVIDVRTRRVPNFLTGPLLLSGVLWALLWTWGAFGSVQNALPRGLGDSLLGACVAGLPFVILWLARGSGAGDAKLMIAIGAWLGVAGGTLVLTCTALAGGILAIGWALSAGRLGATLAGVPRAAVDLIYIFRGSGRIQDRRDVVLAVAAAGAHAGPGASGKTGTTDKVNHKLPYAPAIVAGTCLAALGVYFS